MTLPDKLTLFSQEKEDECFCCHISVYQRLDKNSEIALVAHIEGNLCNKCENEIIKRYNNYTVIKEEFEKTTHELNISIQKLEQENKELKRVIQKIGREIKELKAFYVQCIKERDSIQQQYNKLRDAIKKIINHIGTNPLTYFGGDLKLYLQSILDSVENEK